MIGRGAPLCAPIFYSLSKKCRAVSRGWGWILGEFGGNWERILGFFLAVEGSLILRLA